MFSGYVIEKLMGKRFKLTADLKCLSTDCMQLVVTVTRSPAVHFMHALIHHWPVALQSNWHNIQRLHKVLGPIELLHSLWCTISLNNLSWKTHNDVNVCFFAILYTKKTQNKISSTNLTLNSVLYKRGHDYSVCKDLIDWVLLRWSSSQQVPDQDLDTFQGKFNQTWPQFTTFVKGRFNVFHF